MRSYNFFTKKRNITLYNQILSNLKTDFLVPIKKSISRFITRKSNIFTNNHAKNYQKSCQEVQIIPDVIPNNIHCRIHYFAKQSHKYSRYTHKKFRRPTFIIVIYNYAEII